MATSLTRNYVYVSFLNPIHCLKDGGGGRTRDVLIKKNKARIPLSSLLFNKVPVLANATRQEKITRDIKFGENLFATNMRV